jgi:hypothetical protein
VYTPTDACQFKSHTILSHAVTDDPALTLHHVTEQADLVVTFPISIRKFLLSNLGRIIAILIQVFHGFGLFTHNLYPPKRVYRAVA